jgi:hypothetical protein
VLLSKCEMIFFYRHSMSGCINFRKSGRQNCAMMQVPGWRSKNIILPGDMAPDICAALQYIHARMTYEKSVLGLVLGPREEEVTRDARKIHNEKLSVDQTKGTAQNFYWSVVFNRIECVRRYLLCLNSSERHKYLGSFENCYKLPSSITRREFSD